MLTKVLKGFYDRKGTRYAIPTPEGDPTGQGYDDSELRDLIAAKADKNHTHTGYAAVDHAHSSITSSKADIMLQEDGGAGKIFISVADSEGNEEDATINYGNIDNLIRALKNPAAPVENGNNLITNGQVFTEVKVPISSIQAELNKLKAVHKISINNQITDPEGLDPILISRSKSDDAASGDDYYYCFKDSSNNKYFVISEKPEVGDSIYTYEYDDGVDSGNTPGYYYVTFGQVLEINDVGEIGSALEITVDDSITNSSNNPVKSSTIYTALSGKQDKFDVIEVNKNGSNELVFTSDSLTRLSDLLDQVDADTPYIDTVIVKIYDEGDFKYSTLGSIYIFFNEDNEKYSVDIYVDGYKLYVTNISGISASTILTSVQNTFLSAS